MIRHFREDLHWTCQPSADRHSLTAQQSKLSRARDLSLPYAHCLCLYYEVSVAADVPNVFAVAVAADVTIADVAPTDVLAVDTDVLVVAVADVFAAADAVVLTDTVVLLL